jgi:uncharacterized protein (TIGR00297 family)
MTSTFVFGLVVGAIVIVLAWRARSLSGSGAIAAGIVGTAAAAAGPNWVFLLLAYFVSSSALSRLGRRRKLERTAGMIEKSGPRDARQVLSNGLVFAAAATFSALGDPYGEQWLMIGAGALAASAADTWATEIGTLAGGTPRSVLTGRLLPVGASGGITAAGLVASIAGGAFVGAAAVVATLPGRHFPWIAFAGFAGSMADSITGALLQRRLWCDACGKPTEMRVHDCGTTSRHAGGLSFLENDGVNLAATVVGALVAALLLSAFP